MIDFNVDFDSIVGKIKPMHAVGQPPFKTGFNKLDCSPMQVLTDAHIPYSRLHDVGGPFGGSRFVDIPNIFRNFDADVNDPEAYDFAFTDVLLAGLVEHDVKPYFRLGTTIENQSFIKAYHIHPPKDYDKWAQICEHIVRHYNEGWADGFYYGIEYWEIWNEPENRDDPKLNQMWTGTPEQYYRLYDVTAKHLKKCFGDKIKVGGYAACGFYGIFGNPEKYGMELERRDGERYTSSKETYRINFFLGFVDYIKAHTSPIDFFSWHTYGTVDVVLAEADFVDRVLTENGYGYIETHLNEWNLSHDRKKNTECSFASSNDAAMMLAMQYKKTDMLMFYDAKYISLSAYGGFFDINTCEPSCVYYAFKAFGELYALGKQAELTFGKADGFYAVAATDGEDRHAVMMANVSGESRELHTNLGEGYKVYLLDVDNLLVETDLDAESFTLGAEQVAFIKNY